MTVRFRFRFVCTHCLNSEVVAEPPLVEAEDMLLIERAALTRRPRGKEFGTVEARKEEEGTTTH